MEDQVKSEIVLFAHMFKIEYSHFDAVDLQNAH